MLALRFAPMLTAFAILAGQLYADTPQGPTNEVQTQPARREKLGKILTQRGSLEASTNVDLVCRLRSRPGTSIASTIKWVIDEGSQVKKGQTLLELDDSFLKEQQQEKPLRVETARQFLEQASDQAKAVQVQTESELKKAAVAVELARLDLKHYVDGEYPLALLDLQSRLESAEADVAEADAAVEQAKRGQPTGSLQAKQLRVKSARTALEKLKQERRVLEDFVFPRKRRELEAKIDAAVAGLERMKLEAKVANAKIQMEVDAKRMALKQEQDGLHAIEEDLRNCTLVAPRDGFVVYATSEQARQGVQTSSRIVAQGEPVSPGQVLLRLPDLSHMDVQLFIPEAVITHVRKQQATKVFVDAFPGRELRGQVKEVATVASPREWYLNDIKVYAVKIALDGILPNLKPGMSAEVVIDTGRELGERLTIPRQAVVRPAALGKPSRCFVKTPKGIEEREIQIQWMDSRVAVIYSGVAEGEQVVVNPRVASLPRRN